MADYNACYWQKKHFFEDHHCQWMAGWGGLDEYGKAYDPNTGVVRDLNVRGEAILKYRICRKGA